MTQESATVTAEEVAAFRERVLRKLTYSVGKDPENASDYDWFHAVALATRDSTIDRWMDCTREAYTGGQKRVYYLSLEFLIGRLLVDSLNVVAEDMGLAQPTILHPSHKLDGTP